MYFSPVIMRKIFLLLLVLSFVEFNAQYKPEEITDFFNVASNKIYAESKGYYFLNLPKEKNYKERISGEISINDTSNINFNEIDVEFVMDDYQYYVDINHNLLFVLKSINHINKEINNEK